MSSTTSTTSLTSGFIDLSTFDELEKYLYGGMFAVSYFVRKVHKSTWFTVVPTTLTNQGTPNFNIQWNSSISRAGDYLLFAWLRTDFPQVILNTTANQFGANGRIRWTRNLMHNLVAECALTFNDLVEMRFDNYYMDFWSQFTIPAGKRNGYNNMIGNFEELNNPLMVAGLSGGTTLPAVTLDLPLPLCHTRDTGVSLPTAALPYNDMLFKFTFRNWNQLLILDNIVTGVSTQPLLSDLASGVPQIGRCYVWAEYAIVSNEERKQMGKKPRDILIEQVQTASPGSNNTLNHMNPNAPTSIRQDVHFSHPVKALFFSLQNVTNPSEWSNYTTASPVPTSVGVNFNPSLSADPISTTSLYYENTQRLSNMGSDYFSLIVPFYRAVAIPLETGYHLYCYTLDLVDINPMGSTNFGKLTNVAFEYLPSANAVVAANSTGTPLSPDANHQGDGAGVTQSFQFIVVAVNHNVSRVTGGALGFPVL